MCRLAEPFQKLVNQGMILGEPELTGFRTTTTADGDGLYDAATLKPLLHARSHIEKVGALAVDHFQGSLADRWPHYAHLESEGKTCLYSALRQGVFKVSTDRTDPTAIDQHPSLLTVRETIRRIEPDVPTDQDPIRWWNNEKGLDATLRMLDAAVESLSAPPQSEWVSIEQVSDAGDGGSIDAQGRTVEEVKLSEADVVRTEGRLVLKSHPQIAVRSQAHKMSKSRGNVINPDEVVSQYGADSLRLYEMFMGPLEQVKPWSMSGVEGVSRFLGRAWRMIVDERADDLQLNPAVQDVPPTEAQDRVLHKTIQTVTEDVEKLSFNTAISRLMEFTNEFTKADVRPRTAMESFVLLLAPFAPHIAEELWQLLGHAETLAYAPWPQFDESKVAEDTIEIPVQVNGKLRAKITVPADATPHPDGNDRTDQRRCPDAPRRQDRRESDRRPGADGELCGEGMNSGGTSQQRDSRCDTIRCRPRLEISDVGRACPHLWAVVLSTCGTRRLHRSSVFNAQESSKSCEQDHS